MNTCQTDSSIQTHKSRLLRSISDAMLRCVCRQFASEGMHYESETMRQLTLQIQNPQVSAPSKQGRSHLSGTLLLSSSSQPRGGSSRRGHATAMRPDEAAAAHNKMTTQLLTISRKEEIPLARSGCGYAEKKAACLLTLAGESVMFGRYKSCIQAPVRISLSPLPPPRRGFLVWPQVLLYRQLDQ